MARAGRPSRTALVLGGGGITGAWFEIGALRALDAALYPRSVTDFDVVVGVSAGSVVGSHVAAGIRPHQMVEGLARSGSEVTAPFRRRHVLRPNWRELASRAGRAPRAVVEATAGLVQRSRGGHGASVPDALLSLGRLVPAGLLDGSGLESATRANLERAGTGDRFDGMRRELFVVAVDVDSHARAVFGTPETRHVPVSRAVLASSSFPPAFPPCRIDGHDYVDGGIDNGVPVDVAVAAGARLVVCVNPLLPLQNDPVQGGAQRGGGRSSRLVDAGMPGVVDQAVRLILYNRVAESMADVRRRFPDVDVVVLQPLPRDETMFVYNVARFSARLQVARAGYLAVRADLVGRREELEALFLKHGLALHADQARREGAPISRRYSRRPVLDILGAAPLAGPGT